MILYRQFLDTFAVHFHHSYLVDIHFFSFIIFFLLQKHGKKHLCLINYARILRGLRKNSWWTLLRRLKLCYIMENSNKMDYGDW